MAKIRILTPVHSLPSAFTENILAEVKPFEKFGIEFSNTFIKNGPSSIESHFDEVMCAPYTVAAAIEAEKDGIDAAIINCMGDPGLSAAREAVSIPIFGPGETSMHVAAMMGHRFSIITVLESVRPLFDRNALTYGVASKMAPVRIVNVPVLEIEQDKDALVNKISKASLDAIQQDHADCIILGCTGFLGLAEKVEAKLKSAGYSAPVINPMPVTSVIAAAFVNGGLTQSPLAYPSPNKNKEIKGFDIPEWKAK